MFLCTDCHDYIHAAASLQEYLEHYWKTIEYWGHKKERTRQKVNKLIYHSERVILIEKRLKVLNKLNTVENIKKYGYRTYWRDKRTHGTGKTSSIYKKKSNK
jgi:hypothetical protein